MKRIIVSPEQRKALLDLYRSRDPLAWIRACDRACRDLNGHGILGKDVDAALAPLEKR